MAALFKRTLEDSCSREPDRFATSAATAKLLIRQAEEAIATYPYSEVPDEWRRLYMDASLLHVATSLMLLESESDGTSPSSGPSLQLLALVRVLDMANIVTGYFEDGRRELLFSLMDRVRARLSPPLVSDRHADSTRPAKRARRTQEKPAPSAAHDRRRDMHWAALLPGIDTITRYSRLEAPDMYELSMEYQPFIVTGGVSSWPAISDPTTSWADTDYLRRIAGKGRIVPVEVGSSYTAEGWTQKMMDFDAFLDEIDWSCANDADEAEKPQQPPPATLYLAQHDLFQQFPSLLKDIIPPDYVFAAMDPPEHYPEYAPPASAAGYTINAWMGPKGTYSPAHTDPFYNCYAQVVGSKHIWIAPPDCTQYILARAAPASGEQEEDEDEGKGNAASQYFMSNTAQLDVFAASRQALGKSSGERDFMKHVAPRAKQAILKEGDLLFMPPK